MTRFTISRRDVLAGSGALVAGAALVNTRTGRGAAGPTAVTPS